MTNEVRFANEHLPTIRSDAAVDIAVLGTRDGKPAKRSLADHLAALFDDLLTDGENQVLADRIFRQGEDLPRGGDGETWGGLTERMNRGVEMAMEANGSGRITVVSHGGAIRAYVLGNLGVGWPEVLETIVPANTGVTHVVMTASGPILADYAVATHLE